MRYWLLLLVVNLLFISGVFAQIKVSGHVHSTDAIPIKGADILIHNITSPNRPLVQFTKSDEQGYYSIIIDNPQLEYSITVRAPEYHTITQQLKIDSSSSEISLDFILNSSVSFLDTVKVDLKVHVSVTGDTITFNPTAFMKNNETNIEDLLKRLPGLEVREGGKLYFNGRQISAVLLDGDDLFKDGYQMLTQNAAPKIVDQVQVIKNYKKDELLKEFNRPGEQVINLKIKDSYKNYLFGNTTVGVGDNQNKVGDLFLIKLGKRAKTQAGINYNTTGNNYLQDNQLNLRHLSKTDNPFFEFVPADALLSIAEYRYHNIPDYYQDRNQSIRANLNSLLKKKDWEVLLNTKFSKDRLRDNQEENSIYRDGTLLFAHNNGVRKDYLQQYNITATKNAKKESIYLSAGLQNARRVYRLHTESNHDLESRQNLNGDDADWQFNFNYNRKIGNGTLWSSTLGYYNQHVDEDLLTDPDFLFWLLPDDMDLYRLLSTSEIKLQYLKAQTNLTIQKGKLNHEITLRLSQEKRTINSAIDAAKNTKDTTFFSNGGKLSFPELSVDYKGIYSFSKSTKLTLGLSNTPQITNVVHPSASTRKTIFFYDYSLGISTKSRSSNLGITGGTKMRPENHNLFFPNPMQTSFHRLLSGRIDTSGIRSHYLQTYYSLFNVKLGWIAFLSMNLVRNHSDYIQNVATKGIAVVNAYNYFPNNINQMFVLFNSQKTLGKLPFSMRTNIFYNNQSVFTGFNGEIRKSNAQFVSTTFGFRSSFESSFNFDYNFSWFRSRNKVLSGTVPISKTSTLLNKINVEITPPKLFNTTLSFNNMITNSGSYKGSFLDLKINKRFFKGIFLAEMNLRNLFNQNYLSNTVINSYYTQENRIQLRGREFFLTMRYEFR